MERVMRESATTVDARGQTAGMAPPSVFDRAGAPAPTVFRSTLPRRFWRSQQWLGRTALAYSKIAIRIGQLPRGWPDRFQPFRKAEIDLFQNTLRRHGCGWQVGRSGFARGHDRVDLPRAQHRRHFRLELLLMRKMQSVAHPNEEFERNPWRTVGAAPSRHQQPKGPPDGLFLSQK